MNKFVCYDDVFVYNKDTEAFELPKNHNVWFADTHGDVYRIVSVSTPSLEKPTLVLYESDCGEHKAWCSMFQFINTMQLVKSEANLSLLFWLLARSNVNYTITSTVEASKAKYSITTSNTVISGPSMLDVIYELYLKVYDAN